MTLIIENADERLLKVIKALNIDNKSPYKVSKNETKIKTEILNEWKKESKDTLKAYKAGTLKVFKDVDSMIADIEKSDINP